jgi:hypothetical protein
VKTDRYSLPFAPELPLEFVYSNDQVHGEWGASQGLLFWCRTKNVNRRNGVLGFKLTVMGGIGEVFGGQHGCESGGVAGAI